MTHFKIRASQIHKIMTNPRTKSAREAGELSETAKTYCRQWLKEQLYNRQKPEISSKYIQKGNEVEDSSIAYAWGGKYSKNTEHFENEYISGTPDVITPTSVEDIKSSWDCFTFPTFANELPNKDYYWQMLGYMDLTGKREAGVNYVLVNLPDKMIEKEWWRTYGTSPIVLMGNSVTQYESNFLEFAKQYKYDDVPRHLRYKRFTVTWDSEQVAQIYERVKQCRSYITMLETLWN